LVCEIGDSQHDKQEEKTIVSMEEEEKRSGEI
jgi:hypothetical protein